jgi:hypothetical protein
MRGLATQILLPAFFITVAMTVALTAPGFADPPPMVLSTAMFAHLNRLYTPVSGLNDFKLKNLSQIRTQNANPIDLTGYSCDKVYQNDYNVRSISDINWSMNSSYETIQTSVNQHYAPCKCSMSQSRFICPNLGKQSSTPLLTNDRIFNITDEQNEILYYLYTTDRHHLDRYGGLSFGLIQDYVPGFYPTDTTNQLLHKLAVKNTARVFTNHKGYHSLPLYINIMSNIVLRANLPYEKGLPSAYGITTINRQ